MIFAIISIKPLTAYLGIDLFPYNFWVSLAPSKPTMKNIPSADYVNSESFHVYVKLRIHKTWKEYIS